MAGSKTEAGLKPDNSLNKIINQFLNADNSNEQSTGQEVHSIFDVIKFLNSSDGKKLINEIAAKIFEEETTKERAQAEQRNEERLINQIKMAFLLYFLEERADAAQKMNELVEKQNTQAIQQAKGPSTDLNQPINNESKPSELNSLMEDNEKLLEEKKGLEEKGKKIDSKYSAMSEGLQNVQADDKNLSDDDIRKKIKELDSQLDAEMAKMDQMDEEGDYSASMNKINSLNLQAGAYRDMLDVREGTKYYADENGKKIDSAENAKFILKDDEQIVKRGDKTYLLNKKDDFDSLSPEDQEKAAQNYQRSKDQVLLLKDKVQQDESAEKSDYQSEVNTNAAAISAVGSRMSALKVPQAYIAPSSPSPMVQSDPAASRPPDPQPVSPTPVNSGPE
ncbi:MAG: hypothetical protein PSV35_02420, partial [bacterium]|nr:hypothetical protein [bacterium]